MNEEIFAETTRAKAEVGPMNQGHEDQTMTTTIKDDTHKTPHNSTAREKDVRKEKVSLSIRRTKVKEKVEEKKRTIKEIETQMRSKNLK